jgi:hypothetical protein
MVVCCVVLVLPTVAVAASGRGVHMPLGLFGIHIPSIGEIVHGVVNGFFKVLVKALVPDFLRKAAVDTLKWLIAVPNPSDRTQWPTLHRLEGDMAALAVGLVPLTMVLSATRYWLLGLTAEGYSPATALTRTVGAVGGLVVYSWLFAHVVTFINVLTHAILSFRVVGEGLRRTVGLLFGGALFTGAAGVFVAVLGLFAIFLATALFLLKVATLLMFAVFFVTGPLAIALSPIPETGGLWRAWKFGLVTIGLIPVGWCVIFAVAGALASDATHLTRIGRYGPSAIVSGNLVAALGAIITFYLALRWPLVLLGHVRNLTGGISLLPTRGVTGRSTGRLEPAQRAMLAKRQLTSAALAGGRGIGAVAGAAGAPGGGLLGSGARAATAASGLTRVSAGSDRTTAGKADGGSESARAPVSETGLRARSTRVAQALRAVSAQVRAGWEAPGRVTPQRGSTSAREPISSRTGAQSVAAAARSSTTRDHTAQRAVRSGVTFDGVRDAARTRSSSVSSSHPDRANAARGTGGRPANPKPQPAAGGAVRQVQRTSSRMPDRGTGAPVRRPTKKRPRPPASNVGAGPARRDAFSARPIDPPDGPRHAPAGTSSAPASAGDDIARGSAKEGEGE